ncbi:hypothetical protein LTR53_007648 [Teratosphaeriaceae sp. CCFEE 6253]|nr:hypothetical protein LTR53_007648 [Teratosphaeriaceae sp. CCFEE 6253]
MALNSLKGKVALITGGSKGIGRATSIALAKASASVVINYSSDSLSANAVIKEIGSKNTLAIKVDAGSIEGAKHIVKATIDHFGKLDVLIPNAGVLALKDLASTTKEDFDTSYRLNVKGPYFLI